MVGGTVCLSLCGSVTLAQEPSAPGITVEDPLVVKPTTIAGNFDAALLMVRLTRLELAKQYLQKTLDLSPTDEDLLALRDTHGTATFLELSRLKELDPPATELLNKVVQAVRNQVDQPGYADSLIKKLNGSARERSEATAELRHLGPLAVSPILRNLEKADVSRGMLTSILNQIGTDALAPLIGALQADSPEIRAVAAEVIGNVGSEADSIWLWFPSFSQEESPGVRDAARIALAKLRYGNAGAAGRLTPDDAPRRLMQAAHQHLTGTYAWPVLYDDQTEIPVWVWDHSANTLVEQPVSRHLASLFFAERLSREAAALAPDSEQPAVLLLSSLLIRTVEGSNWQTPLPIGENSVMDLAVRCGPDVNDRVLRYGLDQNLPAAALGALQALSLNGSPAQLQTKQGRSAVIEALDSQDQRIQFAAATTILHWEPTRPFKGANRVVEILARALNADSRTASVVMDPNTSRAQETASLFSELGFSATPVTTGMEGFQLAAERGDIALAVLHPNVIRWELMQTIANLRADSRTAKIPVVIYGPKSIRDRFTDFTSQYQQVVYLDEGESALEINRELRPFLVALAPPTMTPGERVQQTREAAGWLRRIAIRNVPNVFDLTPAEEALSRALGHPDLAEDALIALGGIPRPVVQTEFLKIATSNSLSPNVRKLAAYQLAFHIQRHGLLLKPDVASTLPNALKQEADPQVRIALASVIGSLNPSSGAVRKEILRHPQSFGPLLTPSP
ncbi:MAG TPA: HEAT repeat domain-containing protein [Planctomicrobium sp.]|nr:HEAT repeat domain-containing protein [Planctomicrobium sp.]